MTVCGEAGRTVFSNSRWHGGIAVVVLGVLPITASSASSAVAASCESLATLSQANTTITSAQSVGAGEFMPPGPSESPAAAYGKLPAFCRVAATLRPSSDSDIKIEVWLPFSGWNGKLQSVGNGGWAGFISYPALARGLADGYATASTDTGHTGNTGSFALGHPEKMIDFGYRSEHEMTVAAKAIIAAYYGDGPRLSYWNGCSTGGRQGLTEAQRYPSDYNAIIAGAPANNRMHIYVWSLWIAQAVHQGENSYIPPSKYAMIHKAVMEACDALDGLKDGLISNPRRCHFDPKVLACKGVDEPSCLTSQQVEVTRKIYSAAKNPRTGEEIYPGLEPGSELGWANHAGPEPLSYATDGFKYVVFKNPDWDFRTLNLDSDVALADKIDNGTTSALDPNLKEFFRNSGKLLMYHGWSDPQVSPVNTVNYFNSVLKAMDGAAADSIRLFMLPGMGHCGGGDGPNTFDAIGALAQWFEKGQAPNQMVASHSNNGVAERTRPICAYPQIAAYAGTGSIDEAANFVCKVP
ncbi:MAG: tannase/feruloyl esterase family alpha/beta hydrolase [Acidobacteria bacterium]|nr:MAG: tannase/feruloyl esterase family alpha/beta hydrolase [Acidobacteriota bacterium]